MVYDAYAPQLITVTTEVLGEVTSGGDSCALLHRWTEKRGTFPPNIRSQEKQVLYRCLRGKNADD